MEKNQNIDIALVGDEKQNEINIYMGGRNESIVAGYSFGPYIRDFYQIEYCAEGAINIHCDNGVFEAKKGDLYIIPPHTIAKQEFIAPSTTSHYIGLKGIKLTRYFKLLGFSPENIIFPHKLTEKCIDYFNTLINSLEVRESLIINNLYDEHIVKFIPNKDYTNAFSIEADLRNASLFSLFLTELLRIRSDNVKLNTTKSVQQEYIDNAVKYIETNYHQDISVEIVANHVGIDRSYLFRLFRDEFGTSVHDYIIRVRMRAACDFLSQSDVQIKTVAASVGYEQFNFSKIFKRVIGITPQEYKKKHRKI